jgi:tetratricopeptide (TPR) repeat protein
LRNEDYLTCSNLIMNYAKEIVDLLTKEELRNFKLFASRTNDHEERKDLKLIDAMRSPSYDEDKVAASLYDGEDRNSFYRLKNRLVNDLGKSLLVLHYERSDFNQILNKILLGRLFLEKGNPSLAHSYFVKAEKQAVDAGMPELLNLIYNELIRLSQESLDVPPEEYIRKRKENRKKLLAVHEIDDVLAAVIYKIRNSQTFSSGGDDIVKVLEKTIKAYSVSPETRSDVTLRTRIYQSVSRILLQRQDFISLEKYLVKTFKEFTADKVFNKNNHEIKLQMLVYLVNSLFKNEKHEKSLDYVELLRKAMEEYDRSLYSKYLFYYYNGLVINYTVIDKRKAISTLEEAIEQPEIIKSPVNQLFLRLNLAVVNFDLKDFKISLKHLVKLYRSKEYDNLDASFRLKIRIAELLIRYELDDFDFILHQITLLKKEFADLLKVDDFEREGLLLGFLKSASNDSTSGNLSRDAAQLHKELVKNRQNDVINYSAWLKDRFMKRSR